MSHFFKHWGFGVNKMEKSPCFPGTRVLIEGVSHSVASNSF